MNAYRKDEFKVKIILTVLIILISIIYMLFFLDSFIVYGKGALIIEILFGGIFSFFFLSLSIGMVYVLIKVKRYRMDIAVISLFCLVVGVLFLNSIINPIRDLFNEPKVLVVDEYRLDYVRMKKRSDKYCLETNDMKFYIDKNMYYKLKKSVIKPKLIIRYWKLSGTLESIDLAHV